MQKKKIIKLLYYLTQLLHCELWIKSLQRNHRRCQSPQRGVHDKPRLLRFRGSSCSMRRSRAHIFGVRHDNLHRQRDKSRVEEEERKRERRSVGGRTPDNAVPPDTHPSRAVCNYPCPEIIYECEKERGKERVGTIRTRENCATKSYTSGEGARYDPPYAVENHINSEAVAFPYFDLFLLSLPWKHSTVTIDSRSSPDFKILGFYLGFLASLVYSENSTWFI